MSRSCLNARVGLRGPARREGGRDLLHGLARALVDAGLQVLDLLVVSLEAQSPRPFRAKAGERLEDQARVRVAARDPGGWRRGGRRRLGGGRVAGHQ